MAVAQRKPSAAPLKDLYDIGEIPPLGHVPAKNARLGDPQGASRPAGDSRCSSKWCRPGRSAKTRCWSTSWPAASTTTACGPGSAMPVSPLDGHKHPFHIAGSDASGIVWAVGSKVKRWKVGDEVIVHCNQDDGDDEDCNGGDPLLSPSQRIWGYETPDGSFAQFCRVQSRQLMQKPRASDLGRSGLLHADAGDRLSHAVRPCAAHAQARRQRAGVGRLRRARRVRRAARRRLRRQRHRHRLRRIESANTSSISAPRASSTATNSNAGARCRKSARREYDAWVKEARRFGKAIWDITGKRDVDIVFEHPGEATFPVSCLVVKRGGMVVFCAGTIRLQHHVRRALRVDAAEAGAGLALRASQTGERRQPFRHGPPHRSVHERRVSVGRRFPTRTN